MTRQAHRRDVFWQISLPLTGGVIVVLVLAVLTGLSTLETTSRWADISLIFLILPLAVATFLLIAVTGGLVYAVWYVLKLLPPYARVVQDFFYTVQQRVRQGADLAVEPVLRASALAAGLRALKRNLRDDKT